MIRLGHVYSNLMIDMPATNEKLRRRAVRMVELVAQVPQDEAVRALEEAGGHVKLAAVIARKKLDRHAAERVLAEHHGHLREVLEP
jgi:N-acetylmuramic acid 6-phosphate etherase